MGSGCTNSYLLGKQYPPLTSMLPVTALSRNTALSFWVPFICFVTPPPEIVVAGLAVANSMAILLISDALTPLISSAHSGLNCFK